MLIGALLTEKRILQIDRKPAKSSHFWEANKLVIDKRARLRNRNSGLSCYRLAALCIEISNGFALKPKTFPTNTKSRLS